MWGSSSHSPPRPPGARPTSSAASSRETTRRSPCCSRSRSAGLVLGAHRAGDRAGPVPLDARHALRHRRRHGGDRRARRVLPGAGDRDDVDRRADQRNRRRAAGDRRDRDRRPPERRSSSPGWSSPTLGVHPRLARGPRRRRQASAARLEHRARAARRGGLRHVLHRRRRRRRRLGHLDRRPRPRWSRSRSSAARCSCAARSLPRGNDLQGARPSPAAVDLAATGLYGLANTHGALSVVSVVGSLYPVATIGLARAVLRRARPSRSRRSAWSRRSPA